MNVVACLGPSSGNVGVVDADTSLGMRGWNNRMPHFDEYIAHPERTGLPADRNRPAWPDAQAGLLWFLQQGVDLAIRSRTASALEDVAVEDTQTAKARRRHALY